MSRIASTILIVVILANGGATVWEASGLAEDTGVTLAPGVNDAVDNVVENMKNGFSPQIGIIDSIISLLLAGLGIFKVVITGMFALPGMLTNLGLPDWIVYPLTVPMYVVGTLEMVYLATGRDMV